MSFSCFNFLAHDFCTIPINKSSQSDINRENKSEDISSHPIDSTFTNNSSLSISDTSLDRLRISYYIPNIYITLTFSRIKAPSEEKVLFVFSTTDISRDYRMKSNLSTRAFTKIRLFLKPVLIDNIFKKM
jgi:hypothetical protein